MAGRTVTVQLAEDLIMGGGGVGLQDLAATSHFTSTGALQKALTGRTKTRTKKKKEGAKPLVTKHEG